VGLYGAAFKPIEYLLLALAVLLNPMFPLLARWHGNDPSRFRTLYQRGMEGVLAVTLPIAIVVMLTADAVVALLYPTDFAPSAAPMRLLGVALVLMILNAWHGFTLLAAGHQRITLAYDAAALAINAGLSIALIPMLSILGPAVGSVAACLLAFGCSLLATWRLAGVGPSGRGVAASVGAGLAFGASLWLLRSVGAPWPLALLLAGTIYPAWLLLFGVIRLSELRRLLRGDRSATAVIPGVPTP
jgi:O-antigen/teichoic acid export membrane protein